MHSRTQRNGWVPGSTNAGAGARWHQMSMASQPHHASNVLSVMEKVRMDKRVTFQRAMMYDRMTREAWQEGASRDTKFDIGEATQSLDLDSLNQVGAGLELVVETVARRVMGLHKTVRTPS